MTVAKSHTPALLSTLLLCGLIGGSCRAPALPDRVYTIGSDNAFPYHYLDNQNVPHGMVGDLIAEAARRKGIRLDWRLHMAGPAGALPSKQTDLWPLLARQPKVYPEVYFTQPYLRNSYVQIGADPRFNPPQGIAAVRRVASTGMRLVAQMIRQAYPAAELVVRPTRSDALAAVCSGDADVVLVETRAAEYLLLHRPPGCETATFDALGVGLPQMDLAIASTPEAAAVAEALRSEIDRMMADGAMRQLLQRWDYYYSGEAETLYSEAQARAATRTSLLLSTALAGGVALLVVLLVRVRNARRAAVAADRAKSLFVANISHEIRTPMSGVIGMLRLARDAEPAETRQEYIDSAIDSADALLAVINDVLDFSKIEAGRVTITPNTFDTRVLARQALANVSLRARQKGLAISCDVASDVPQWVAGDDGRIRQVLLNLLANAVKFTDSGSVSLRVSGKLYPGSRCRLEYTVSDTGIGISGEQRQHLFERFRQGDDSMNRKYGGTGLGLAISKRLTDLMGGDIDVESVPGKGSTFRFWIPVSVSQPAPALPATGADEPPRRSLRVLVAEDNPTNQKLAAAYLGKRGHQLVLAGNGREALERAVVGDYDVILMDVQMPIMDGLEATRRIRETERRTGKHVRVVALTAHASPESVDSALSAGMDDYIAKPFKPEELFAKIEAPPSSLAASTL
jgi:signal transduction histidine kinase/CheY-like chemotaxis protein